MAKSKAQRMKEYRERKKQQLGDEWLKRERERTKPYFKKILERDDESREKRRLQNRESQSRFRLKKKHVEINEISDQQPVSLVDDENGVTSTSGTHMTVKMDFPSSRSSSAKKRVSRALAKSYRRIETLEDKNEELKRKLKNAQKRLNRYTAKKECNTPTSKADRLLKDAGLRPDKVPEIRKQLVYSECVSQEIKLAKQAQAGSCSKQRTVHKIVSGKIIKKYRMRSFMENLTSLSRKKSWTDKGVLNTKRSKLNAIKTRLMFEIATFLERDDNSRMLPGKNDAVKSSKDKYQKTQKRVLNDYMYNLHLKFLAESTISISRASFYRCRPKHVSLVNFASRNVCLCVKHQNFSFLLRSLKSLGVTTCTSPDKFVEMYQGTHDSFKTMLDKIPTENDMIKFQQWKRVTLKNGKQRQRVVDVDKSRTDFISMMFDEFKAFVSHVTRVKEQYVAIKQMKDKLPDDHVLVQMDFSENYTCTTLEEIQSAYWNSCIVTLHPVVIYYRSNKSDLQHSSYVYVSEVLSHNATMVISIIEKLMKVVKGIVPNVKCIHFWTDSPSSQYRNKTIFDLISKFKQRFDVNASWHYFECGHGKGPCDGVGGTTKRNADNAVKQGKALIQDAGDFFAWASTNESYINYELVTEEEYEHNKELVEKRNSVIKPLKGSMLFHAVIESGVGEVLTRNTSCACDNCFRDGKFDRQSQCGWDTRLIEEKTDLGNDSRNPTMENQLDTDKTSNDHIRENHGTRNKSIREQVEEKRAMGKRLKDQNKEKIDNGDKHKQQLFSIGRFVVASYDERIYVGKITDIDPNDKTININFMQKCDKYEGRFKWPITKDELWIDTKNIIKEIEDPKPTGKSGRIFTIDEDALKMLQ